MKGQTILNDSLDSHYSRDSISFNCNDFYKVGLSEDAEMNAETLSLTYSLNKVIRI